MSTKKFKCPLCDNKYYLNKQALYSHIEKVHPNDISDDMSPARLYFNWKNHKEVGICTQCRKNPTKFNESSERYERFCSEKCKKAYVDNFKNVRMVGKYGTPHLLNNPDQQKKMLAHRKISGEYKWSSNNIKFEYTGEYELEFLKFLDLYLHWSYTDLIAPAPQVFEYEFEGKKHLYLPDFYLPSINTIVEIKTQIDPRKEQFRNGKEKEIETLKDEIMINQKSYNYIKINDKNYMKFIDFLMKLKNEEVLEKNEKFKPLISINEAIILFENTNLYINDSLKTDILSKEDKITCETKINSEGNEYKELIYFHNNYEVGRITIHPDEDLMANLFIKNKYRKKGYATKLIMYSMKTYNVNQIRVFKNNKNVISLYKKLGFTNIKKNPNLIYDDRLYYMEYIK